MPSLSLSGETVQFITLKGQAQELGLTVEETTRKGVDGHAFRKDARRATPFDLQARVDCDSMLDAQIVYETLLGARGSLVGLTDDYGQTYANLMLLDVEKTAVLPLLAAVGGVSTDKKALLTVRLKLQATQ